MSQPDFPAFTMTAAPEPAPGHRAAEFWAAPSGSVRGTLLRPSPLLDAVGRALLVACAGRDRPPTVVEVELYRPSPDALVKPAEDRLDALMRLADPDSDHRDVYTVDEPPC